MLLAFLLNFLICAGILSHSAIVPAHSIGNASWPYQTYKTVDSTPPYLAISRQIPVSDEYLFFAPDGATDFEMAPLIMDMNGELVWNGPTTHAFGFGAQQYNNETVLVWWNGTVYPEPIGRGNGVVHVVDKHYNIIKNVTLRGHFLEQVPNATFASNIDLHEIFITKQGTMLVTANNVTQSDLRSVGGSRYGWVVAAMVYEIDIATTQVLFSWNSLDHLDELPFSLSLYTLGSEGYTGENQSLAWGYFHINAVSPYDGGYILSSRFLCSAIAIGADGNVKWRLQGREGGDFILGTGVDFCYQHDIRAIPEQLGSNNSTIMLHMHDNHNSPIENNTIQSSGKVLSVDLEKRHVTLQQRYLNESGPIYSTAQGNYQSLASGNVFIGHGWIPVLEEFSPAAEILTTVQFGAAEARAGGGFVSNLKPTLSYRAFKQPWIGCPMTRPDLVAERSPNGTAVYVSWNGATEVEAWDFFVGNDTHLTHAKTVPKQGFETMALLDPVEFVLMRQDTIYMVYEKMRLGLFITDRVGHVLDVERIEREVQTLHGTIPRLHRHRIRHLEIGLKNFTDCLPAPAYRRTHGRAVARPPVVKWEAQSLFERPVLRLENSLKLLARLPPNVDGITVHGPPPFWLCGIEVERDVLFGEAALAGG
ncbi:hypothetical protein LTR78_000664 [Recurvomyces mirabilis]|uniref:ASST-domain-containing protein n=1 Tax=Recurvomyces mirabilis TaxID=574656 RepID=A0AAE1C6T4_9PEZI|nr:hypothetical protein LTR78_000664 [Recurvomyces mirabilis]KAK5162318.1 hypothetical protein LTS14_000665 [Recurvomyces mirabilis]